MFSSRPRRRRCREFPLLRISSRVVRAIAHRLPLLIKELQRLLKQSGRWRTFRNGRLEYVQTRPMPVDSRERNGCISIEELQSLSLNQVRDIPCVMGYFGIPLKEFPRRVNNRSLHIRTPVVLAGVALSAILPALLGPRGVYFLGVLVIDDRGGVAACAILDGIDAPR